MITLLHGDCRDILPTIAPESVQCIVTSPPYYALRDYGVADQIGLEAAPDCLAWARQEPPCGACYVCALRHVFSLIWPALKADGVAWLNLGDSYAGSWGNYGRKDGPGSQRPRAIDRDNEPKAYKGNRGRPATSRSGIPEKNTIGVPWRVALALQADGWILRSDIVWSKPNCMPESVKDRPTRAHEYVFLLAKQGRYFFDSEAIAEPGNGKHTFWATQKHAKERNDGGRVDMSPSETRNARTVWTISTKPFSGAHFAVFPEDLVERCIRAGSRPGDLVLDPFGGSGTVARVAERLGRSATMIELSPEYIGLQEKRINGVQIELPLIAEGFYGD